MVRFLLPVMALAVASHAEPQTPSFTSVDASAVSMACGEALGGQIINAPARTVVTPAGLICFRGQILPGTAATLVAALEAAPRDVPVTLFVESAGGSTHDGLDVAEAVLRRRPTVVTGAVCGSSCANYIFVPAGRRIVGKDSVVAFHGGVDDGVRAEALAALEAERATTAPNATVMRAIQQTLDTWEGDKARQAAMLRVTGADPRLLDFHGGAEQTTSAEGARRAACRQANYVWTTFSPSFLADHGVVVESWQGPTNQVELDALSRRRSCWWG